MEKSSIFSSNNKEKVTEVSKVYTIAKRRKVTGEDGIQLTWIQDIMYGRFSTDLTAMDALCVKLNAAETDELVNYKLIELDFADDALIQKYMDSIGDKPVINDLLSRESIVQYK